ncbi:MAG: glycosyl transferase, group 1 [Frankiales bacterium]|nr:glycosyl transferase, group 1 [Frankiales bacterium]
MLPKPLPTELAPTVPLREVRYIYIACPWTPVGGGMFKVADYLIQSQAAQTPEHAAQLRPLDSRGAGSPASSLWVLATALAKIVWGRASGRLAGVHVNMAERMSLFRKGTIVAVSRAVGVPVVLHLHAAQLHHFYRSLPAPLQALVRWMFSLPATVVVIGPAAREFVTTELGVALERVEIMINGVPEATEPRCQPQADEPQRVLFLGNLSERKGVTDLLQALARPGFDRSRLEVMIAGGGDVEGYQAKARRLGVQGFVRFEGWCDQEKVARLLAQSDVLVLPSKDEVLPLVILEALANRVAVVCTPVGEIPSLLSDGLDACFVKPGDVDDLAAGLQKVLQQPVLRETLVHNGRALYERQFSLRQFFAGVARIHRRHFGIAGQPLEGLSASQEHRH